MFKIQRRTKNREKKFVIHNKPLLLFQEEWGDESPTDSVTKTSQRKFRNRSWLDGTETVIKEIKIHMLILHRPGPEIFSCLDFAVLFYKFVWKKIVYLNVHGNH